MSKGWHKEPVRHREAALKGIGTRGGHVASPERSGAKYRLHARDGYWEVTEEGYIDSKYGSPSADWRLFAIVPRWNTNPQKEYQWSAIKAKLDRGEKVEGYIHDIDHGTRRFWGGSWNGKLPKGHIIKIS